MLQYWEQIRFCWATSLPDEQDNSTLCWRPSTSEVELVTSTLHPFIYQVLRSAVRAPRPPDIGYSFPAVASHVPVLASAELFFRDTHALMRCFSTVRKRLRQVSIFVTAYTRTPQLVSRTELLGSKEPAPPDLACVVYPIYIHRQTWIRIHGKVCTPFWYDGQNYHMQLWRR